MLAVGDDVRRIQASKKKRHEANELIRLGAVLGLACGIVEKELGVNNPLRRLASSRCRGMIW